MKPKTMIQKEVARLSATLRPISPKQTEWAYTNCVEHIAYRAKSGMLTCPDCGHSWKSGDGTLCDTLEGCICPHCGAELKVHDTRRRTQKGVRYFCILTTCRGYQVIRVAQAHYSSKKGEPMKFYCTEVVQRWISPDGKVTDMALLRTFPSYYCDQWSLYSDMEVRPYNSLYDDVCKWSEVYPLIRTIPQLRRNGFKGDFYGISPVLLFKRLLSDTWIETLMKAGEIEDMKYFILNPRNAEMLWSSYLIARRHHYKINSLELWCDYLQMLNNLGQDIRNPKNICPANFIDAHDRAMRRIEAKRMKERTENERRWEA
ncbi:PcfJ domain-containing protein, partial [uncultured Bacteroides sp.]